MTSIENKKLFFTGLGLFAAFMVVLFAMFMPLFGEQNFLNYMDNLYNSISKGSAYYIPGLQANVEEKFQKQITGTLSLGSEQQAEEAARLFQEAGALVNISGTELTVNIGQQIDATLSMANERQAEETARLFREAGALVTVSGTELAVRGGLREILSSSLADADLMFQNNGEAVQNKYNYPARQALYHWWLSLKKLEKHLTKQKEFAAAKTIAEINKRGVETAFNYYGVNPQNIMGQIGVVIFSLVFYVIYTLWFGYSIMFMFEGWGLKLSH